MVLHLLAAARSVVVKVPEASGGASLESILVFAGGVLAAIAAVAAALLTSRGAAQRLEKSLEAERGRFNRQLDIESQRSEEQFDNERYIARHAEASATIEQIARSVSRTSARLVGISLNLLSDREISEEELLVFDRGVDELREESSILAIRFGEKSEVVSGLGGYLKAANDMLPPIDQIPLDTEGKEKLKEDLQKLNSADTVFLKAAKASLESF